MLRKINISIRILMVLVLILSLLNYFLHLNIYIVPAPLFGSFNAGLVIALTYLDKILEKVNMKISNGLYYLIMFSVIVSFVLGMGFKFYRVIPNYDTVIHFFNGGVIAIVGFAFIKAQFEEHHDHLLLITIGAILVAISVGAIWEIYEFVADLVVDGNMQRYLDFFHPSGEVIPFVGQAALMDTMIDIIVDTLGGILAGIVLYRSSTRKEIISNLFTMSYIK